MALVALTTLAHAQPALVFMQERGSDKQIARCNLDGTDRKVLTAGPDWHLYPDVSPDGGTLVYVQGPDDKHLGIKLNDGWLVPPTGRNLQPRLAKDLSLLAYSGDGQLKLLRNPAQSAIPSTILTDHEAYFPNPSSDGSFLVYQGNSGKAKAIYRLDLPNGKPVRLAEGMSPTLSFDDRKIAYTRQVDGNWDVYVLDLTTRQETRHTDSPARELAPAFLPDGTLVYCSDQSKTFTISTANQEGYAPRATGDLCLQQGLLPPIPGQPRSSFGAAAQGPDVFLVGGHQGHEHTYPPESFVARTDFYDKQWQARTPRPVAAHGFPLIAHENYVYAFGGFAYNKAYQPSWHSLDRIDRYDTRDNRWEQVATLPRKRSSHVAIKMGNLVYLIGGWDSTPKHAGDVDGRFHPEIDVFDLTTHQTTTLQAVLPNPLRRAFSATQRDDKIILAGGIGVGGRKFALLDNVTSFDPKTETFADLPRLPFPTFAPALGTLGNAVYVFGGMQKTGDRDYRYVNHIFKLTDAWRHTGRYLTEAKGFSQVIPLPNERLGILGGHTYRTDGTDEPVPTFEYLLESQKQ